MSAPVSVDSCRVCGDPCYTGDVHRCCAVIGMARCPACEASKKSHYDSRSRYLRTKRQIEESIANLIRVKANPADVEGRRADLEALVAIPDRGWWQ